MELLGTVHWVMHHDASPENANDVITRVHAWSERKRSQMKDGHIRAAWERLCEQGWPGLAAVGDVRAAIGVEGV